MDNRVIIGGIIARIDDTRYSPVGVPIIRFVLDHRSAQREAGHPREARCRVPVMACGEALQGAVAELSVGDRIRVSGFLARADHRQGEFRLVLHAERIEPYFNE